VPSFPHVPFLAPALSLRCASDSFSLTKPNTSCTTELPAPLSSDGVRVHPGNHDSAQLTLGDPGCSRTRARVWSSRGKDPSTQRRVRFVRSAGHSHASTARVAPRRPRGCGMRRVSPSISIWISRSFSPSKSACTCAQPCSRMFRAQPPFLRPRAIYTQRVVQKAIDAVYRDGMAARSVPDRLARDFWVKPDEKMVRLWCRAYAAEIDFAVDYQPWVVTNFSGILCVGRGVSGGPGTVTGRRSGRARW
jgi:hypothetical protein